jgi:hypothetical protein
MAAVVWRTAAMFWTADLAAVRLNVLCSSAAPLLSMHCGQVFNMA